MKQHLPKMIFGAVILAIIIATALLYSEQEKTGWFGYVEGEYVLVGLPAGGILEELHVRRGDNVRAGQELFRLEATAEVETVSEARAALGEAVAFRDNLLKGLRDSEINAILARKNQAEAEADLARLTLERRLELLKTNNASEQAVDEAEAAYERARGLVEELEAQLVTARLPARVDEIEKANAAIERARAGLGKAEYNLDKRKGFAPKGAFVFDTFYREGEFVPAGKGVVSLLPPGHVKIRFFVPEAELAAVQYGQEVKVDCDGCGEGIAAKITYIAPEAEFTPPVIYSESARQKLVFLVEAYPLDPAGYPLKPGQPVEIRR